MSDSLTSKHPMCEGFMCGDPMSNRPMCENLCGIVLCVKVLCAIVRIPKLYYWPVSRGGIRKGVRSPILNYAPVAKFLDKIQL